LTLSLHDEDYSRNVPCAQHLITTFLFNKIVFVLL